MDRIGFRQEFRKVVTASGILRFTVLGMISNSYERNPFAIPSLALQIDLLGKVLCPIAFHLESMHFPCRD